MKEFVEYLLRQIVKNEDALKIDEEKTTEGVTIKVTVSPEDMGLVIGKEGRTIRSIRSLAKAKAIKDNVRVYVELVEPEGSSQLPRGGSEEGSQKVPQA